MKRKVLTLLFLVYLLCLLRITVFRSDFGTHPLLADGNWTYNSFTSSIRLLTPGERRYFVYQVLGNIAWFLPFGYALRASGYVRKLWQVALAGFLFSFAIEMGQFVFGTGVSDVQDLILNTLGTVLGATTALLLNRFR